MTPSGSRHPDFLVVGAMKAGTTTLYADLLRNPGIFMPSVKEPADLVSKDIHTQAGVARYQSLFLDASHDQKCGEASTHYTQLPTHSGAADAAARICGEKLRLIYILRDPVDRTLSHHRHLSSRGLCDPRLSIALGRHPELIAYSRYDFQIKPWLRAFPAEAIGLVDFRMFVSGRVDTVNAITDFIGAERLQSWQPVEARNTSSDRRQPRAALRRFATSRARPGQLARSLPRPARRFGSFVLSRSVAEERLVQDSTTISSIREELSDVYQWLDETPLRFLTARTAHG